MKLHFCTLFDSGYLTRGLAMYQSLSRHCSDFHLYVFAFDDYVYNFFKASSYSNLTVISLAEFENAELLSVKPGRTRGEYCWTCTSSTILYCIDRFRLDACTYIDADLYFYSDPAVLIDEMEDNSVLITEHRYTKAYDQSDDSGIYCVQFITFRNDERGRVALTWWKDRCLEWCYARVEDGKFGDQKYLDDWPARFQGVHVLRNHGGGLAPWNIQQYAISKKGQSILVRHNETGEYSNAVFYHFHYVKFHHDATVTLSAAKYKLSKSCIRVFYSDYIVALEKAKFEIESAGFREKDPHGPSAPVVWSYRNSPLLRPLVFLKSKLIKRRPFVPLYNHNYRLSDFTG